MTATTILADLRDRGLSLRVEEGQLRVRPKALLTPADREGIRAVLPEILAALSPDDHLASPIVLPRSPVAEVWDQAEAIRLVGDADDLVAQRGVDGRLPVVVAAAATVASAYAIRDMETVRFAVAEFTVLVRQLAADQRQQRACKGQCRTWSP